VTLTEEIADSGPRIFLCYRRGDTADATDRLHETLARRFSEERLFKDIDDVEPGLDFRDVVGQAVDECDVLLAVIGSRWLTVTDREGRRRLDKPNDPVRLELLMALERKVRVVPVLMHGIEMPTSDELPQALEKLAFTQAMEMSRTRWREDVERLMRLLEKIGREATVDRRSAQSESSDRPLAASQRRHLRVFLASPQDLPEERSRVERVVDELNRTIGDSEGVSLELIGWEADRWPGFGEDAEAVINRETEPGDIFLGLVWRRIGSPADPGRSGGVDEFEQAYKLWVSTGRPTMMFYFKTTPFYPSRDDLTQFAGVLDFKDRLGDKGAVYWECESAGEFGDAVHAHLVKEVQAQLRQAQLMPASRKVDQDRNTQLVLGVLESSRNMGQGYRTLAGLARATGLSEGEVKRVIDTMPALVVRSRIPDRNGAALFKLRTGAKPAVTAVPTGS